MVTQRGVNKTIRFLLAFPGIPCCVTLCDFGPGVVSLREQDGPHNGRAYLCSHMSKHRNKHESTRRPKATGVAPSSYGLLALAALAAATVAATVRLSLLQGHGGPAAGGAAQRPRGADVSCTDGACASRAGGTLFPELGDNDVAVQSSSLPAAGKGAFALREFGPGEHVGTYRCEPKLNKRLKGEGDYDWELNSTTSCDGFSYLNRNPMRYVNSIAALDTCRMENVQVVIGATVSYVATRLIRSGEELLVDYGAAYFKLRPNMLAVGARYECDASPLHLASMRGDEGAVRAQLEGLDKGAAGGLVNMRASSQQLRWTPLMEAAAVGAGDVARLLLQHGARVNSIALDDARPYSALYIASHNGKSEIVSALIQAGARVNQAAGNHGTPLVAASRKGHPPPPPPSCAHRRGSSMTSLDEPLIRLGKRCLQPPVCG